MKRLGWLASIGFVLLSGVAHAQLNGPVPAPFNSHLWSIPGVINVGGIGTYFPCTNGGSSSVTVGIEIFGPAGGSALNNPALTAVSMAPGATVLFGTGNANGLGVDVVLGPGVVSKGSARVLGSLGKGVLCSAFLADIGSSPTASMTSLSVIKKTRQKGQ